MFRRLLVAAAFAATVSLAQPQAGGGGSSGDMGDMSGGGRGGGRRNMGGSDDMIPSGTMRRVQQSKPDLIADKLKLNKEQKEEFDKILSAGREESRPVQENLQKMRAQLAAAIVQGGDADIKKATDDYTAAAAQMTAIEVKAYGKLYAALKPNQQGKAAQALELMAGIFEPRIGGGRGTGRGQGR